MRGLLHVLIGGLLAWEVLATAHLPLLPEAFRWPLAIALGLFGIWAIWIAGRMWTRVAALVVFLALGAVWASIEPTLDKPWRPEVAVMPRVQIDGDIVRITGFRNFDYRSEDDFTVRHEEREYRLSKLQSVDFYLSYWHVGPVGHTFVSFNFENQPPVAISIETRPQVGEGFDPLASLFRHFELIYVVGDERDLVRVRTNHRKEEVFLYRTRLSAEAARNLFLVYSRRINQLAVKPEFYHLLSNSCTINIVRYANKIGRVGGWDIRLILNGWSDRYLYSTEVIDTSRPFDELREASNINAAAQAAGQAPDFSSRIRAGLPAPAAAP
ncbi:DUF4105 domain-containing protein [Variovorax sp. OV329]|uniref:Lnb N-terminal periplasmic domain-containing protein n=1 Tax=Variovorax sp. OV329 TaxID=1882825 RepID=UPI001C317E42|nr:DUF4105 domain-containing protein [Variovorax sp. OV329]